jgi:hypothetical protein
MMTKYVRIILVGPAVYGQAAEAVFWELSQWQYIETVL